MSVLHKYGPRRVLNEDEKQEFSKQRNRLHAQYTRRRKKVFGEVLREVKILQQQQKREDQRRRWTGSGGDRDSSLNEEECKSEVSKWQRTSLQRVCVGPEFGKLNDPKENEDDILMESSTEFGCSLQHNYLGPLPHQKSHTATCSASLFSTVYSHDFSPVLTFSPSFTTTTTATTSDDEVDDKETSESKRRLIEDSESKCESTHHKNRDFHDNDGDDDDCCCIQMQQHSLSNQHSSHINLQQNDRNDRRVCFRDVFLSFLLPVSALLVVIELFLCDLS